MKRLMCAIGLVAIAAACGGGTQDTPASEAAPAASAPAAATGDQLDIELSAPTAPQTGENTFEVMVMQGNQPVTDADVSVELFMAAMPAMKMPEMRSTIPLTHEGAGRYRGTGSVAMAGAWDATVMVMRGGQHLGDEKLTIVAK
jgi:YtkA-like protein